MPKAKLTVSDKFEQFKLACEIKDVKIEDEAKYGQVNVVVINYKHPSQIYEIGLLQNIVEVPKSVPPPKEVGEKK